MNLKTAICTFFGITGSFLASLFGGWSYDMQTLVIFMAVDFATGLMVAGIFHKSVKSEGGALSSNASFKGLCKKGVILLFVLIAHRLDLTLGVSYIRTATIIGFLVNELVSIVENAGLMGVSVSVINKAIDLLKAKGDK